MKIENLEFREIDLSNIDRYGELTSPDKKYHQLNGPYFKKNTSAEHRDWIKHIKEKLRVSGDDFVSGNRLIVIDQQIFGACSWHWRSVETNWLEIGIILFEEANWGKGIGTVALKKWIDYVFALHPQIVRIGLTTWSGNLGMIKLSKKIGLKREACYKNARIVNGRYYDSVSYGILKEDWQKMKDEAKHA